MSGEQTAKPLVYVGFQATGIGSWECARCGATGPIVEADDIDHVCDDQRADEDAE